MQFDLVVANYNNAEYLQELIDSVRIQTHVEWHLYIVDDGSTDNSLEILHPFRSHPQITIIESETNQGATHTFKIGIDSGESPLIGLIGADDTLPEDALSTMLQAFQVNSEVALLYSDCMDCDENMNPLAKRRHAQPLNPKEPVFNQLLFIFNFIVFTRAKYTQTVGLNSSLRRAMDHDLILKLDEVGSLIYVPKICYNYRNHPGGISQGGNGLIASQYSKLARINAYKRRDLKPISREAYRQLLWTFHARCVELSKSVNNNTLFHHAIMALLFHPSCALNIVFWKGLFRPVYHLLRQKKTSS